jgi:hypothetical protein
MPVPILEKPAPYQPRRSPTLPTAIPSHLHPNWRSTLRTALGTPTGTQNSTFSAQIRPTDEIEKGEAADADKGDGNVMEVDS